MSVIKFQVNRPTTNSTKGAADLRTRRGQDEKVILWWGT